MCEGLMHNMAQFRTNFLDLFEKLAHDKVVNVRISVAKVLLRHFEQQTEASKDQRIRAMYSLLLKDHSADVVKILKKEHTIIDEVISSSSSDHNQSRNSQQEESAGESHPNDEVAPAGENILPPNFTQEGVVLPQQVHEEPIKKVTEEPVEEATKQDPEPKITESPAEPVEQTPDKAEENTTAEEDKKEPVEESTPEPIVDIEQGTAEVQEDPKPQGIAEDATTQDEAVTEPAGKSDGQEEKPADAEGVAAEPAMPEAKPQEGNEHAPEEQA